jgi:hypothetical protein
MRWRWHVRAADGKVQLPHVDLMVCTACQLRCVGCTNFMGVLPMEIWPAEQVMRDIDAIARVAHAKVACLLGGEPTSHPKLVEIMRHTKAAGIGDRIQVLTNGMRLDRMRDDFWDELDWLKVSVYPGKTPDEAVQLAKDKQAEYGFELEFYIVEDDPFRAVLTDRPHDPGMAQAVYEGCWYKTHTRKVEQGYFFRCCTSPSISQTVLGLAPDVDGIALEGLTPAKLREFLDRKDHMESCTRCYGNMGPRLAVWEEVRNQDEWMAASIAPLPVLPST